MKNFDLKRKLYKYWDTSAAYYHIAENVHADIEAKRKDLFANIKENVRILDIACGSGLNRQDLPKKVFYCGIDLSFAGLSAARRSCLGSSFVKADAEKLPLADSSFDYVVSTNAVEHFIEPRLVFDEMWRVCKKDGYILLIFPNYGDYIFKYPPSVSYMINKPWYRIRYIAKQFYRQTVRILTKKSFSFAKIDVLPHVFINPYSPDTDIIYLASGREVKNYFETLGASDIRVKSKERLIFARPILGNIPKNIFRIFKAVNPYYSWHGDTILVIKK
jgi:ubiquinone/menaquinone biosynthesis C-methylase UbiE